MQPGGIPTQGIRRWENLLFLISRYLSCFSPHVGNTVHCLDLAVDLFLGVCFSSRSLSAKAPPTVLAWAGVNDPHDSKMDGLTWWSGVTLFWGCVNSAYEMLSSFYLWLLRGWCSALWRSPFPLLYFFNPFRFSFLLILLLDGSEGFLPFACLILEGTSVHCFFSQMWVACVEIHDSWTAYGWLLWFSDVFD